MNKQEKVPIIRRGWICDIPEVQRVWFFGYMAAAGKDKTAYLVLEMLFTDMARHSISSKELAGVEGDLEQLLIDKAIEYLENGGRGSIRPVL